MVQPSRHIQGLGSRYLSLRRHSKKAWIFFGFLAAVYVLAFYYFFVGPFSLRWKAFYGDVRYPDYSIQGIDVSHYQREIDWKKLRNASIEGYPVRFVFIKATEGNSVLDENFNNNFYQAKQHGFIRGAYHYFVPGIPARQQAEYFLRQVHLEEGDLPPVIDIEKTGSLTPEQIRLETLTWLHLVGRQYGVRPILYTSFKFKMKYLNDSVFNQYPYWIAHYYVDTIRYKGEWRFWQHTDVGRIGGIDGQVDFDVYNGSMYDLMKFCIKRRQPEADFEQDSDGI